jgi:hypothetical protein
MPIPDNVVTDVLELHADDGNVEGVENVLATYLTGMHILFSQPHQLSYIVFSLPN